MSMFFGILLLCYSLFHLVNSLRHISYYKSAMMNLRLSVLAVAIYFGLRLIGIL